MFSKYRLKMHPLHSTPADQAAFFELAKAAAALREIVSVTVERSNLDICFVLEVRKEDLPLVKSQIDALKGKHYARN